MLYYSTNHTASRATLRDAVVRGLAEDRGLYMPEVIKQLPASFWQEIADLTFQEVAYRVADAFFGEDVPAEDLRRIVYDTLSFDTPVVHVEDNIYALELFHGPTLAFKDVGARFMARLLQYFIHLSPADGGREVNVLVATSGDTGSAVANGFLGVEGIHVYVLYPKGKVSPIQECQFTTLGQNITAIEVDGVFDDCQRLVKSAFMDADLNAHMRLTSANSINVARFLPQAFYYFWAYAQLVKKGSFSPSPNPSPVREGNVNTSTDDIQSPLPRSAQSDASHLKNRGGVGEGAVGAEGTSFISSFISSATYTDDQIADTMRDCYARTGYVLDPHGACGYRALKEQLRPDEIGVFLETAHPAKFKDTVDRILGIDLPIPEKLQAFMRGKKQSIPLSADFADFKAFLLAE